VTDKITVLYDTIRLEEKLLIKAAERHDIQIEMVECKQLSVDLNKNTHEINANGKFGNMKITVENVPDSTNPKTSRLATLSAIELLRQICTKEVQIGT